MKKIFIILWSIFFSYHALCCEFSNKTNKKEYTIKNKNITNIPNITEFFSFFCPYCYELKKKYNIKKLIKKKINKNIKIKTYHVNFLGGKFSHILTKSWIIAQKIGIEEKIMLPLFEGIQKNHTIQDLDSIKKLFKKEAGINENQFNSFWNSLTLNILVQKKNEDIKKYQLNYVPTMLINRKYIIDYSVLQNRFQDNFAKKCIELIKFLINKN
ncbi:DsbA family protein [Buchnera aphidicola]|uniref:Thiol:disulfide interchange protein n=1 Tax=Buchnera aphidicola str. USDA (Myzus persicae) TaxID=1009856 RepID=W0P3M3_BUCMP|nr:DsbA family protein [Buchnera aphidicola]AHG59965.1 Dsba [Buchnera aphidicola str. USDA (Myzus persicae)]AHG60545.1 Dsba [Buchnera aphidicola str. W106 (Myzus persicae)]AHG61118.1 Dsba [Buchnera aphidicola str. G002 (Myzus persicae)]AHG61690.1 Dsba [Buchnera aphidicola str. F009 (Myzus persicae)]WAI03352.1 MAG: DsbA family protein [Buchnera aphidicola (Myzus persicae)]